MTTEKTDVVIVGVGAAGGILAAELAKADMKVIGLERGPRLKTSDFQLDELRYFQRQETRPNRRRTPVTWRPNSNAASVPIPTQNYGNQAGGGTVHYGAVSWRFHEDDFRTRSQTVERYGVAAIPEDSSLIDWPLSYADLEPYYDQAFSRRRAHASFRCQPLARTRQAWCLTPARRSLGFIHFHRRARFCLKPTKDGRRAPTALSAKPMAASSTLREVSW